MQCIDEAPEQALAFVGELRAVGCDGTGQDVDGFLDPGKRLVFLDQGFAEQGGLFASCGL